MRGHPKSLRNSFLGKASLLTHRSVCLFVVLFIRFLFFFLGGVKLILYIKRSRRNEYSADY